ncbi:MAG TPA: NAD(P)-dependent oxidoreductase [Acidimicrobiales bacterium]|nr:NAD(P)-dependent oxidoreductase [Acidimicrobiales bacterium]
MNGSQPAPIGFVGVGNMGSAMALRALREGAVVVAYDATTTARQRLADAGATIADSAAAVAAQCRLVSVVVNTDQQVRDALSGSDGIIAGGGAGTIVAIHSTIHLETLEEAATQGAARSVIVVDAAVTGGPDAAARGELVVMVGCDPATFAALRPALSSYASLIVRVGDLGAGMAAKIALMVISFGKLAAAYEGMHLANAAGVDLTEFARIVAQSERQSGLHDFFLRERILRFADGYDGPLGEIARHESPKSQKDLHAAIELAARVGVAVPFTALAHGQMPEVWGLER